MVAVLRSRTVVCVTSATSIFSTSTWEHMELLVLVKAYPAISTKYGEAVCVAGIRLDTPTPQWARLFPVGFRDLPADQQFRKYDVISLEAQRHLSDRRAESYRPNLESICITRHLKSGGDWAARRRWVEPMLGPTMCELFNGRRDGGNGPSLGVVRPRLVVGVFPREREPWSARQQATLAQGSLLNTKKALEQPAHAFAYHWFCEDASCKGHQQSIADWELGQACRSWERDLGEVVAKVQAKWLAEMCSETRDTMFFVGDQHQHPGSFMILGTFWPERRPHSDQLALDLAA